MIRICTMLLVILICSSQCTDPEKKYEAEKPVKVQTSEAMKLKALILDGQNNHGVWPKTTMMLKDYLTETGLFAVDILRTKYLWIGPHYNKMPGIDSAQQLLDLFPLVDGHQHHITGEPKADPDFSPEFENYDVVISNLGWKTAPWPSQTKKNFEKYMLEGGGFVVIHAANNAWGDWDEYNKMIGFGGWGGRAADEGNYVYYDDNEKVNIDSSAGQCGSHGPQFEFVVKARAEDHPIMKGLPTEWLHTPDELYDRMRGPAENVTVLATAFSGIKENAPPWDDSVKGTGRHEPMLATIRYGEGRTFHTLLGHMDFSMECVGFTTTFQRGAEWAATGKVTQNVPSDFPTKENSSSRKWH